MAALHATGRSWPFERAETHLERAMGKKKTSPRRKSPKGPNQKAPATPAEFGRQAKPLMAVLNKKVAKDATDQEKKVEHLRAYHRLGPLSLELLPERGSYGKGSLERHAEKAGLPLGKLYVARRFAQKYNKAGLDQFCKHPLGVNHLRVLLDVQDKRQRARLQKQGYDQNLSVAALLELKKQLFGRKRAGGAPIKIPDDPKVAVLELLSDGDKWVRHCDATTEKLSEIGGKRVPAGLKDVAAEGIERLKALTRAARQAEKELKRVSGDV
jgi:hypothetical protein